jgi:stage V sporulation protein SpoVS
MPSREAVMTALLALLAGTGSFVTVSRRNRSPESIGPAQSPALMLVENSEEYEVVSNSIPPKRVLVVSAILYNDVGADLDAIPATAINNALDALDLALQPQTPSGLTTLPNNLVESVKISGEIVKAPGDRTGKSLAVVPIRIVLP